MDPIFFVIGAICLIFLISKVAELYQFYEFTRTINKIPGPKHFPVIGLLVELLKLTPEERLIWMKKRDKEYKDGILKLWIGTDAIVRLRKPEHIEHLLPGTENIRKSMFYTYVEPWLGKGLLTSTGEKWFRDRKLLTPAFHFNILEQFAVVMNEKTDILVERLDREIKKNPGQPIEIFHFAIMCTLDIICKTAMGLNVHAQDEEESEYVKSLHRFSRLLLNRFLKPWYRWDFLYRFSKEGKEFYATVDTMHRFTEEVIRKRILARQQMKENGTTKETEDDSYMGKRKTKAFLDLLLDANENTDKPLTNKELREQVDTFMFTGHDTTAAAITWSLFCLGNHLDIQERIHEELQEVFGDSTERATLKQLSELKHLDRAIKEALRLYPSAPEFSRLLVKDVKIDGYRIPKDANITVSPYLTHRDPDHWPDAEKFDPDRFLPENTKDRHPYAYIPFSAGPRNCIGQKYAQFEEKIVLTAILRKWKVKCVETPENIEYYAGLILRPSKGVHIHLIPKK